MHFSTHSRHCGFAPGRPFCINCPQSSGALAPPAAPPTSLTLTVLGAFLLFLLSHLFPAISPSQSHFLHLEQVPAPHSPWRSQPKYNFPTRPSSTAFPFRSKVGHSVLFDLIWFSLPVCAYRVTRVTSRACLPLRNHVCFFYPEHSWFSVITH